MNDLQQRAMTRKVLTKEEVERLYVLPSSIPCAVATLCESHERLRAEVERLRRGEFTDTEMRELSYHMPYDHWLRLCHIRDDIRSKLMGFRRPENEAERQWLRSHPSLAGKSTCCECGEDYPSADHAIDGHIFCPECRTTEKE